MPESETRESRRTAESGGRPSRRVLRPEPAAPEAAAPELVVSEVAPPEAVDPGAVDVEPVDVAEGEAECSHPAEARDYQSGTCAACGAILWD